MKNLPINSDKKFKYSITFSNWDNESLEIGETDDKGFEYQDEIDTIGEILYLANDQYGIDTPTSFGSWESSQPKEDADFYEKGINKYYTLHIHNLDGSDISQEENDFISFLLSDGRLEINKFREYAVGGLVAGAIAVGIGGLIAYYYFKDKKPKRQKVKKSVKSKSSQSKTKNKASSSAKSVTHIINGKKRKFPIKDAWRKEHNVENKSQDYEVPQTKRKPVKYAKGGLLQGISNEDYFLVVQNWVYFTYNYPRTFFEQMSEFHKEKFSILYEKNGSRSVVPAFWKSISDDAKYKMAIWIKNNYYNRKSEKEKLETISDEHYFDILNHWNHFSQNPPMNFVEDVFESMSEHFEEKWITAYKNVGAIGSMNKFFTELSEDYQKLLTDWVYENYDFDKFADGGGVGYEPYEMIVISKELEKDGGRYHKHRFLVSAKNIDEAKQIATDLWNENLAESDLHIVKVMSESLYKLKYWDKFAGGGGIKTRNIKFDESDFNKIISSNKFNIVGNGNYHNPDSYTIYDSTSTTSSKIMKTMGTYYPSKEELIIRGNINDENPLVKWLNENYDFDTFELGGRVTTNEGILESFLTTNKQLNVNNLSTHYNEYDDEVLLRNYGTLIATRKGNDVTINKTYFSKTTSTITNKLKNMALNKRMNVNYVDKFADGGLINVKHSTRNYKDTDEEINVYEVDLGTLNVGNNHTTSHMITAIQESEIYDDLINELGSMISNSELVVKYKDNYGNNYRTDYDSSEFYDFVKRDSDDEYAGGGGVSKLIVIENPYNEKGTFFEHTAKENISKIMNEVSFRKFGNEFRKHIDPYFTQEFNIERVNTGISWSELASYIIGDGDYSVNEEQYNNFIKAFNTTYNKKDDSTFAGGGEAGKYKYGIFTISENGEELGHTFYSDNPDLELDPYGDDVPVSVGSNQIVKLIDEYADGGEAGKWVNYDKNHLINTETGMIVSKGTNLKDIKPKDIKGFEKLGMGKFADGGGVVQKNERGESLIVGINNLKTLIDELNSIPLDLKFLYNNKTAKVLNVNYEGIVTNLGLIEWRKLDDRHSEKDGILMDFSDTKKDYYFYFKLTDEERKNNPYNFMAEYKADLQDRFRDYDDEYAGGGEILNHQTFFIVDKFGVPLGYNDGYIIAFNTDNLLRNQIDWEGETSDFDVVSEKLLLDNNYDLNNVNGTIYYDATKGEEIVFGEQLKEPYRSFYLKQISENSFAEGGEVEDWMEEALESLIEETGFDNLEITIVSDEGDEFYCSDGDAEYRVFKTEDDAKRVAIQQVREDLTETPERFNKDWLMNHIDGRSFFENKLNKMNKKYAEDIKEESDVNYPNRLIAEMVDYGIIDSEDAFSMSADELANYYMNVFVTMLTEDALNQGNDGLDYFVSNFGKEDTYRMIIKNNLINLDDASEDAVNVDGIEHFLFTYDGETVYLDDNNVAYRVN